MPYTSDYPIINTTADVIMEIDEESLLLIRRKRDPFKGMLAIPGGFVEVDERVRDAAVREFGEETGLTLSPHEVIFDGVADGVGRDPRGRTISMVFVAKWDSVEHDMSKVRPGDDAEAVVMRGIDDLRQHPEEFAFDHYEILFGNAVTRSR